MAMEPKIPARVPPSCLQQPKRWWQHSSLLETCKEICLQNMIMPQNVIKKTVVYHVWSLSFAGKINLENFWNRRSNPIASLGFVSCLLFMYFWSVCSIHPGKTPIWKGETSEPNLHDFGFHGSKPTNLHRKSSQIRQPDIPSNPGNLIIPNWLCTHKFMASQPTTPPPNDTPRNEAPITIGFP